MTVALSPKDIAAKLEATFPGSVEDVKDSGVVVHGKSLHDAAAFLRNTPGLDFNYLSCLTAIDYVDYFEVTYNLTSLQHNHSAALKVRCPREAPSVPSVVDLWKGADLQEREVYDLMGVSFDGHPNMKRLFLWEGFQGHPLRKDYL